jgi:hypothetical protein
MRKRAFVAVILASAILLLPAFVSTLQVHADPTWSSQVVDAKAVLGPVSLAMDSYGNPHMVYVDSENGTYYVTGETIGPLYLMYASWTGSNWDTQTAVSFPTTSDGATLEFGYISYNSLAFDSNNTPYIVFTTVHGNNDLANSQTRNLKIASWTGTNWTIQTIDSGTTGPSSALEFLFGSIVIDSNKNPHIAYIGANNILKYASWTGSSWTTQAVSSGQTNSPEIVSSPPYLALDSQNRPNILFDGDLQVKLAVQNSSGWTIQTIVSNNNASNVGNLVLDSNDHPHFTYENEQSELMYESWNGSAWSAQNVTGPIPLVLYASSSLALDSNGNPHIAYSIYTPATFYTPMMYASWTASGWTTQTAYSTSSTNGNSVVLALDSNGNPHIGWVDLRSFGWGQYTSGTIWYATSNQPLPIVTPTPPIATPTRSPSEPEFPTWVVSSIILVTAFTALAVAKRKKQAGRRL